MLLRDNFTSSTTDWSWVCSIIILNALDWFEKLWSVVDMRKWYCRHRAVPQQKDHKIKSITQSDLECTYTPRNSTSLSHPSPTSYTRSLLAGMYQLFDMFTVVKQLLLSVCEQATFVILLYMWCQPKLKFQRPSSEICILSMYVSAQFRVAASAGVIVCTSRRVNPSCIIVAFTLVSHFSGSLVVYSSDECYLAVSNDVKLPRIYFASGYVEYNSGPCIAAG